MSSFGKMMENTMIFLLCRTMNVRLLGWWVARIGVV